MLRCAAAALLAEANLSRVDDDDNAAIGASGAAAAIR